MRSITHESTVGIRTQSVIFFNIFFYMNRSYLSHGGSGGQGCLRSQELDNT